MKQVRLPGTDLRSSVLGFGCSPLMGRLGRSESLRLLETAYDAGITHFDVARSYGYGDAESVLGDFTSTKRDKVTITTKFGILPSRRPAGPKVARSIARKLVALNPRVHRTLRQRTEKLPAGGYFSVQDAKSSLESSLQKLRTDYVDILLLHECKPKDLDSSELLEFLEACVEEGKTRYFGVATDPHSTRQILRSHKPFTSVVQFANSVLDRNIDHLPTDRERAMITHSVFSSVLGFGTGLGLKKLHEYISSSASRTSRWSTAVGKDCSNLAVLSGLMLNYAVQVNHSGIVLYSSRNERNIMSNVAAVSDRTFSRDQIERFLNLVAHEFATLKVSE